ncbi:MAG: hypothetical protein RIC87_18160 [Kiloniellales bacterium]
MAYHEYVRDLGDFKCAITEFRHNQVMDIATKSFIPVPNHHQKPSYWSQSGFNEEWRLSDEGVFEIWSLARKYRKEKVEYFMSISGFIIGIIGSATALISIL